MSPQQRRFWNELTSLRGQIEYLYLYERHYESIDRGIKIFLAVASSGSIAAWTIWRNLSVLWGGIIAAAHFINTIKDYLPFERRLKSIQQLTGKLEAVFVQWETVWNQLAAGGLSDQSINSRLAELKKVKIDLLGDAFSDGSLPDRPKLHAPAASRAALYFNTIYAQGEGNGQDSNQRPESGAEGP
jgi:hypothetical protein